MKLVFKMPTESPERDQELLERGFQRTPRSRGVWLGVIGSLPFMYLAYFIWHQMIMFFHHDVAILYVLRGRFFSLFSLGVLLGAYALTFTHEFLHCVLIPNFIRSQCTFFGITWYGGFVHSEEEMSRNRYRVMYIMPYLVISIVLMTIFGLLGWLNDYTGFIFFLNSLGSSVDIAGTLLITFLIPKGATVTQNGTKIYYRLPNADKSEI